jgi:hypothetical protein
VNDCFSIINWEGRENNRTWVNLKYKTDICLGGQRKTTGLSIQVKYLKSGPATQVTALFSMECDVRYQLSVFSTAWMWGSLAKDSLTYLIFWCEDRKVKLPPLFMNLCSCVKFTVALTLNLDPRWEWMFNFTRRPLNPGKKSWVLFCKRPCGPKKISWISGEEKCFSQLRGLQLLTFQPIVCR